MAGSAVQIYQNDARVKLFWVSDKTGAYRSWNLYWSMSPTMAGEALIASNISNVPDGLYSKNDVIYEFARSLIGLTITQEFYVRVKGVSGAGVEDAANPGPVKLVPATEPDREEYHASQTYGYDYEKDLWKRIRVKDDGALDIDATLVPGDTGIGAVEIKDHDSELRVNVTDMGGGDGALDVRVAGSGAQTVTSLFSAQALTHAYVYSASVDARLYGQGVLSLDYNKGDETSYEMKVQFSYDGTNWFNQIVEVPSATVTTTVVKEYQWTASTDERIAVAMADMYVRVGVKATGGTPTGTVSISLTLGNN